MARLPEAPCGRSQPLQRLPLRRPLRQRLLAGQPRSARLPGQRVPEGSRGEGPPEPVLQPVRLAGPPRRAESAPGWEPRQEQARGRERERERGRAEPRREPVRQPALAQLGGLARASRARRTMPARTVIRLPVRRRRLVVSAPQPALPQVLPRRSVSAPACRRGGTRPGPARPPARQLALAARCSAAAGQDGRLLPAFR